MIVVRINVVPSASIAQWLAHWVLVLRVRSSIPGNADRERVTICSCNEIPTFILTIIGHLLAI